MAFIDIDDTIRQVMRVDGYKKQGAAYGYSGVKGVNAQIAALSSPVCAPVIAASRLRKGNACLRARRGPDDRRRHHDRPRRRGRRPQGHRTGDRASGQRVLRLPGDRGGPPGRRPLLASPPGPARPSAGRSAASTRPPGSRSTTRTRSGTTKPRLWSATPRSPKWCSPRSPAAARTNTSPAGSWSAGSDASTRARRAAPERPAAPARAAPARPTAPTPVFSRGKLFAAFRFHTVFTDSPLTLVQASLKATEPGGTNRDDERPPAPGTQDSPWRVDTSV